MFNMLKTIIETIHILKTRLRLFIHSYNKTKDISIKQHLQSIQPLYDYCVQEIAEILNTPSYSKLESIPAKTLQVCFVSVARGGNIPATILHYQLSQLFMKEIERERTLKISLLYCALSTRGEAGVNSDQPNQKALTDLRNNLSQMYKENSNLKVYVVDDLLDTGYTCKLMQTAFCKDKWVKAVTYLFCFIKPRGLENLVESKKKSFTSPIVGGQDITTDKWLNFWYE